MGKRVNFVMKCGVKVKVLYKNNPSPKLREQNIPFESFETRGSTVVALPLSHWLYAIW
jgi:hypothetical protein